MRGVSTSRSHRPDLLSRPPCGVPAYEDSVRAWVIDPVEQLEELADLVTRGLLSPREFEHHRPRSSATRPPDPPVHGWCLPTRVFATVARVTDATELRDPDHG